MITMDTRDVALVEITEYLPKTRGLTDAEFLVKNPDNAR